MGHGEAEPAGMGDSAECPVSATPQDLALSPEEERVVRALLAALRRIRHGSVQLVVQDSRPGNSSPPAENGLRHAT